MASKAGLRTQKLVCPSRRRNKTHWRNQSHSENLICAGLPEKYSADEQQTGLVAQVLHCRRSCQVVGLMKWYPAGRRQSNCNSTKREERFGENSEPAGHAAAQFTELTYKQVIA